MLRLAFFVLLGVAVEGAPPSCEGNSNCACISLPNSYEVVCPKLLSETSIFTADYIPGKRFQITCQNAGDISMMKGLNIGPVNVFAMKFCPLPKTTFKELMTSMNISQVSNIEFKYSDIGDSLLPEIFEGLENVTHIYLNNNGLTSLPENLFDGMPRLTSISLWDNRLKSLPRYIFSKTPQLEVLELGSNQLVNLEPGVFKNLSHLRLLNLWSNQLVNLTRSIFADVPNLEKLDLNSCGLKTLPPDIFTDLAKLSTLNLNNNEFTHLPYGLFYGTPLLESLRLNYNRRTLQTLPNRFLSNLTLLREVTITQCNISTLPEDLFWYSPNISNISFDGNQLTQLPKYLFRDTKGLQAVNISHNKLDSLPDWLFSSTSNLKDIKLSHNNLRNISSLTFKGLRQLETLDLEYNKLSYIDPEAFASLQSLTRILLSNNELTFEDSNYALYGPSNSPLQYCKNLEIVLLANNRIGNIFQDWQYTLPSLQILDLSQNKIKLISKEDLLFLSHDVTVNLNNNEIKTVNFRHIEQFALVQMENVTGVNYKKERNNIHILIGNNPIICDCFIYDLIRYFVESLTPEVRYLFNIDIGETRCAAPVTMQYAKVSELNSSILTCACDQIAGLSRPAQFPSNCSCAFRVHDSAIIIDCSNGNFDHVPEDIPTVEGSQKTELYMSNNALKKLPANDVFVKHNISKIDVSHNQISDVSQVLFPRNLQVLRLDHNNLTVLPEKILGLWGALPRLMQLTLHGNRWKCDCDSLPLMNFIHGHYEQIPNHESITCSDNVPIKKLKNSDLCPFAMDLLIFSCVTIAVLGVLTGLLAAMYYRYQREIKVWLFAHQLCLWFVTEEELDKDKKYDAFVSYSNLDRAFVEEILVPKLESGPKRFKLCLHYRDWEIGSYITNSIINSVDNSRRTLIVLSKNFIESDWSKLEFQAAHKRALNEGRARVIIILYGDIGAKDKLDPEIKTYLSTNTYVEWGDPWFWQKLRYALPHPPELRKKIPGELRDKNIRRVQAEKLDLMRKSNNSLNIESTPPANSVTSNPLNTLNSIITNDFPVV